MNIYDQKLVRSTFAALQKEIHETAKKKGWWNKDRNEGELIALMHSELSETLEAFREGNPPSEKVEGISQAEEELADTIIRILDMADKLGFDIGLALVRKMVYNETREYRHGGKKF